jgi:hypothetical protein
MANYNYRSQFTQSNAAGLTKLLLKVSIGAAGAPTIAVGTGMGIKSIVRNSAGQYTINLSKPFTQLLDIRSSSLSGVVAPASPTLNLVTDAVASKTAPAVTLQYRNSGAATDPASGEILYLEIELNSSTLSS